MIFQNISSILGLFFVMFLTASHTNAAKILVVFTFPGMSHFMMTKTLIKELLARGHEVTSIVTFPMEKNLANYTEVLIEPVYDFGIDVQNHFQFENYFDITRLSLMDTMKLVEIIGVKSTEHALKQAKVQEIFSRTETKNVYDLLIAEQFYQEAFLALAVKYDIPVITMSTMGYENYMSQMMGMISPWSYVPHGYLTLGDKMSFWERITNTFACLAEDFLREYVFFPKQDELVKKYLSHLPMKIPKVSKMEKSISAILLNSHVPLTTPRPTMLGMISVGGMHIDPPNPLPADIKKFMDGATHGVIYFSLGSNVQSADMPPEKLKIFLDVFAEMKQRIVWKFEDEKIQKLPKNVMIKKWMPQNDVLAHPNVKLFITHGGLLGCQEGVQYGVPMLGMPIYCDQFLNMNKATRAGYAITIDFNEVTKDNLKKSLTELIENPSYKQNVERISQIFRDRPQSPRKTAMYWVEYVIRHKGAPHLRSAGLDLAWYEFYLLDVIGVILLGVISVLGFIYLLMKRLMSSTTAKQKTS